jgi:predicted DNA-binding protein (MmcQ/YjbR family)
MVEWVPALRVVFPPSKKYLLIFAPNPKSYWGYIMSMNVEQLREFCLSLPHAFEDIKWGNDLCFCIGDKMFATASLNPASGFSCSFKCTPEKYSELIERDGIISAPYTGRFGWVCVKKKTALSEPELQTLIKESYAAIMESLPTKTQKELKKA